MKTIRVRYCDQLCDQSGIEEEAVQTGAGSPEELFRELNIANRFTVEARGLRTAINNEFVPLNTPLWEGDTVSFLPPLVAV